MLLGYTGNIIQLKPHYGLSVYIDVEEPYATKQKTIEFKDEDKLEEFYSQYGYEFDEQPIHVQNKSIQPLKRVHINDWWKTFFNCTPRISFLENAVMQY